MIKVRTEGDAKNKRLLEFRDMDEGDYRISNEGHIMSLKGTKKIIQPWIKWGKANVKLYKNGKRKNYVVDDLMKKYFPKHSK